MPGAGGVDAAGFAGAAGHSAMLRGASRSLLLYRLHWWSDSLERSLPNESVDGLIFTRFRDEVELFIFVSGKTSREFFAAAALERVR